MNNLNNTNKSLITLLAILVGGFTAIILAILYTDSLFFPLLIASCLIFFILRFGAKRQEIYKPKAKNIINSDCMPEKQHYLEQFRKRINFITLLLSVGVIIFLVFLYYNLVYGYPYHMYQFDQETMDRRIEDAYICIGFMALTFFGGIAFWNFYLRKRYNSYKPIILKMPKDDFREFQEYEETRLFYNKFKIDYLICENYLYIFGIKELMEINIYNIEQVKDIGYRSLGRSSYYLVTIKLKNGGQINITNSSKLLHDNLIIRLEKIRQQATE